MKQGYKIACGIILLMLGATAPAQTQPSDDTDLAPGFKLRASGGIDIGDMYAEVVHFDSNWKETEEHDVFTPTAKPTTQPSSRILSGAFKTPGGEFTLTEQIDVSDQGVHFSADMSSDQGIDSKEVAVAVNLPVAIFGGKEITVDGQAVKLPQDPAPQDQPQIFQNSGARQIDLPTPDGTLTLIGDFDVWLQDDRQWGDQRYGLRLRFSPDSGQIKDSKIDLQMKWKPAENK
jgi:hypothetical protein